METTWEWDAGGQAKWIKEIKYCCEDLSNDHRLGGDATFTYDESFKFCPFCGAEFIEMQYDN